MLAGIIDKKDKILNKLYKRRVELDFSRKTSAIRNSSMALSMSSLQSRSIASSLTCCQYCGMMYLHTYTSHLVCANAPLCVNYRGRLERCHQAISSWSLTVYLKSLHAAGLSWESIYWHVWAACTVFRSRDCVVSALETSSYIIGDREITLRRRYGADNVVIRRRWIVLQHVKPCYNMLCIPYQTAGRMS